MRLKKLLTAVLTALLVTGGVVATTEGPALAVCSPGSGFMNGYDNSNTCQTFRWSVRSLAFAVGECNEIGPANDTGYVWNDSKQFWWAWTGDNCTGDHGPLYPWNAGPMAGRFYKHVLSTQRRS